jgi:DHA3 family macrolide efflux protein-like MFS transporter
MEKGNYAQQRSKHNQQPQSMRPFFIIWTGQAVSLLGSQLVQFALVWWLTETTGSATVLAVASMVALLPQILIGPFAGVLVDRWNRRLVLMVADTAIALATFVLVLLFRSETVQVWHVYALMFIRSTGAAFHWPAMQASTTLMVPQRYLSRVGGLNQTLQGLANILVPPLGALAIAVLPMQSVLAIDIGTAIVAIAPLFFIPIPQPSRIEVPGTTQAHNSRSPVPSMLADMREALRFVLSWKGLLIFSAVGMLSSTLGGAAASLRPIVVLEHFGGGALELGWLQAAAGIGAVLGGLTLGVWGGFRRRVVTSMLALVLDGIALTLFGLATEHAFLLAVTTISVSSFMEAIVMGANGAIFQTTIPPEMQGRVFALLISLGRITLPLGLAIAGPVADALGAQVWYLMAGIVITVTGVAAFFVPAIMRIEEEARSRGRATLNRPEANL